MIEVSSSITKILRKLLWIVKNMAYICPYGSWVCFLGGFQHFRDFWVAGFWRSPKWQSLAVSKIHQDPGFLDEIQWRLEINQIVTGITGITG